MSFYETAEDRARESAVLHAYKVDLLVRGCGAMTRQTEKTAEHDAEVYWASGKIDEIIEVKTRNIPAGMYSHYIIDRAKVDSGIERADALGADFILLVQWQANDIRYINLSKRRREGRVDRVSTVQRRDRVEQADRVYKIPIRDFTRIT